MREKRVKRYCPWCRCHYDEVQQQTHNAQRSLERLPTKLLRVIHEALVCNQSLDQVITYAQGIKVVSCHLSTLVPEGDPPTLLKDIGIILAVRAQTSAYKRVGR